MQYELWHLRSGNLLECFASEREALIAVREYLELNGFDLVHELALGPVQEEADALDEGPPVLQGEALLARVRRQISVPSGMGGTARVVG